LDLCQLLNDDLAATVKANPKRFIALGTLPMQAPELAVREMKRCVKVNATSAIMATHGLSCTGIGFPWSANRFPHQ
jgi:predicted acyltransferase